MKVNRREFLKLPALFSVGYWFGNIVSSNDAAQDVKTTRESNPVQANKKPTVEKMEKERALYKTQKSKRGSANVPASIGIFGLLLYGLRLPSYKSKLQELKNIPEDKRPVEVRDLDKVESIFNRRRILKSLGVGIVYGAASATVSPLLYGKN